MDGASLLGFTTAAVLLALTPGADTMLVLRAVWAGGGARAGRAAAVGIGCGCIVWGIAALAGIAALVHAAPWMLVVMRWAGAAYLLWLGVNDLLSARRSTPDSELADPGSGLAVWRSGFLTNLLNPKVVLFYLAVLPGFVPAGATAPLWGALLIGIHVGAGLAWLCLLAWLAARATGRFARPSAARRTGRLVSGVVLVTVGAAIAVSSAA